MKGEWRESGGERWREQSVRADGGAREQASVNRGAGKINICHTDFNSQISWTLCRHFSLTDFGFEGGGREGEERGTGEGEEREGGKERVGEEEWKRQGRERRDGEG